jgi:hypothetical protein|tara:strand:- start:1195 stop:1410 length:216 start_codon:yes stop_codon:yes gene_type:complete
MNTKRGRPQGTTKANGYKVAQDCDSYWKNRAKTYRKTTVSKKTVARKPTTGFLTKVSRGLDEFLRPFNQVS